MPEPIGYLVPRADRYVAVCASHRDPEGRNTPLYRENIAPHGQRCATCGCVLVQPAMKWGAELYGRR